MDITPVYTGLWSIFPPLISILFALIFREIISSLTIGLIVGTVIYTFSAHSGVFKAIELFFYFLEENMSQNVSVIIFTSFLGAISQLMIDSGSSYGYAKWVSNHIKSKISVQISSILLSFLCAIDDVFLCFTVGNVMRPVMDKNKVSRAKFAYILDMMSSPICMITPFSSWTAAIVACISSSGLNGMDTFIKSIPFNFYAVFSIFLAIIFSFYRFNFGPMNKFEIGTEHGNDKSLLNLSSSNNESQHKGNVLDLIFPIVVLILGSTVMILETGGFFSDGVRDFSIILKNANSGLSISIGSLFSILSSLIIFVPRKMSFEKFMESSLEGIKSMISTSTMLVLAFSMSFICEKCLLTGEYIRSVICSSVIPENFLPLIIFILSSGLSFSIGSSWGTFGILIPMVSSVFSGIDQNLMTISISAVLSGSVFGVHCSPISSAGMIASTGAGCKHLDHISSQVPYAFLSALSSSISFIICSISKNLFLSYLIPSIFIFLFLIFLKKVNLKKPHIYPKK